MFLILHIFSISDTFINNVTSDFHIIKSGYPISSRINAFSNNGIEPLTSLVPESIN